MAYTTQYIGSRYVPLFAEPAEWDSTRTYEPLTIVMHDGNSYTSRQYVPVGIDITNEKFWALTGNYNAQVEAYRKEVRNILPLDETPTEGSTKGVTSDGIKKAIDAETTRATTAEETNATAISNEFTRAKDAEQTLQAHVDEIAQRKYVRSFSTLDNLLAENIPVGHMAFVSGNGFIASYTIAAQKHNDYDSYQMSNGNYAVLNIDNGELIFDSVNDVDRINGIISTGSIGTLKFLPKKYNLSGEIVSINDISIVGNNTAITGLTFSINLSGNTWARPYPNMALTMRGIRFENYDKVPVKCGGAMQFIDCRWYRTKSCAANIDNYVDNVRFIGCSFIDMTQRFIVCQVSSPDKPWFGYGDNNIFENCEASPNSSNAYATFNGSHVGVINNCINLGVKLNNINSKVVISNSHYEAPIIIGDVPIGSNLTINDCYICCRIDRPFYTKETVRFNNCVWYINNQFTFGNKYPNESPMTVYGNNNQYADTHEIGGFYDEYKFSFITPANDLSLQKTRLNDYSTPCFSQVGTFNSTNGKSNFPDGVGTYTYNIYPSVLSSKIIGSTGNSISSFTVDIKDTSNSAMHVFIELNKNMYYHIYRTSPNGNIYKAVISASFQIIIDRGNFIQGVIWTKVNNIPTDIVTGPTSMIGGIILAPNELSSAPNISGILCVKPDGTIIQGPRYGK